MGNLWSIHYNVVYILKSPCFMSGAIYVAESISIRSNSNVYLVGPPIPQPPYELWLVSLWITSYSLYRSMFSSLHFLPRIILGQLSELSSRRLVPISRHSWRPNNATPSKAQSQSLRPLSCHTLSGGESIGLIMMRTSQNHCSLLAPDHTQGSAR